MKKLRRMAAFLTALILCLGLSVTAFAAESDTGFSDVDAGDWYAEAAAYCRDNGLMSGTGGSTFSPDTPMTRGMLVTVLYRLAGSPTLENENLGYPFADVSGDSWYADGVYWARLNGVVSGYSDSAFSPSDPLTREQLAAILWRYAGEPCRRRQRQFCRRERHCVLGGLRSGLGPGERLYQRGGRKSLCAHWNGHPCPSRRDPHAL